MLCLKLIICLENIFQRTVIIMLIKYKRVFVGNNNINNRIARNYNMKKKLGWIKSWYIMNPLVPIGEKYFKYIY